MSHRVLVTPRHVANVARERQAELDAAGVELVYASGQHPTLSEEELLKILPGCVAAIAMPDAYTARVIDVCTPPLRLIARSGVGYDSIDVEAATARGVWVTTSVGSNHDTVADYTLGLILSLARQIVAIVEQTRGGVWERITGTELRGKVLGVIGAGRVGKEVTARAQAFGMPVVAYDLYPDQRWAEAHGVRYLGLPELLASSDFITLHAPSTPGTRGLLNAEALAQTKRGVYIVNTARGELVDEPALRAALDSGQVAGAALDVFREEPPLDRSLLLEHPKVLPLAHCAGATVEAQRRSGHMAIDDVLKVVRDEPPAYPVNRLR